MSRRERLTTPAEQATRSPARGRIERGTMLYFVGIGETGNRRYLAFRERESALAAARNASVTVPGRVWIEGLQSASGRERIPQLPPEVLDATLADIDERFRLTSEEERQRDLARQLQDAPTWRRTVASLIELALYSYQHRERPLEAIVDFIWRVSVGCSVQDRIELLGTLAFLAHRVQVEDGPPTPKRFPTYLRVGTADLVLSIKTNDPNLRVTPRFGGRTPEREDPSSPAIDKALTVLRAIDWFEEGSEPAPATIVEWLQVRRREKGEAQRRGRPRDSNAE